jgi:hypothetical protein
LIYVNAFFVGAIVMGFEMLGSRYLFPYFGGGIGTWAGLISTVLIALTIGYLAGGLVVDRYPSPHVISIGVAVAAGYLSFVPLLADRINSEILEFLGSGFSAILLACGVLLIPPLSLLGMFSPVAIRLQTRSTSESGRVAGLVYGVSTIGNVFGTLFTTFVLIPTIGSRKIIYLFAGMLGLCALSLFLSSTQSRPGTRQAF